MCPVWSLTQYQIFNISLRSINNTECCTLLCFRWTVDMSWVYRDSSKVYYIRQRNKRTYLYCDNPIWNMFVIYKCSHSNVGVVFIALIVYFIQETWCVINYCIHTIEVCYIKFTLSICLFVSPSNKSFHHTFLLQYRRESLYTWSEAWYCWTEQLLI